MGADPGRIEREIGKLLEKLPKIEGTAGGQTYISPRLNRVLDASLSEAARLTDEYVSAEHILVAMADEKEGPLAKILAARVPCVGTSCPVHAADERRRGARGSAPKTSCGS
ncbi:MAG: Clp protease N-terminal domain-containing protein [Thermodesulfobacteriota bacterium]